MHDSQQQGYYQFITDGVVLRKNMCANKSKSLRKENGVDRTDWLYAKSNKVRSHELGDGWM